MEYLVIGADGQEYGPANLDTLKQWVADNRVSADTNLKEFSTGRVVQARSIPFLFPPVVQAPVAPPPGQYTGTPGNTYQNPPAQYPRAGYSAPISGGNAGGADVAWAIGRSVVALIFFFALGGIGLIIAIYGLVSAVRAHQAGHKLGIVAIVISVLTLIAIGIGWIIRLSPHATS